MREDKPGIGFRTVTFKVVPTTTDAWSIEVCGRLHGGYKTDGALLLRNGNSPLAITGVDTGPLDGALEIQYEGDSNVIIEPRRRRKAWAGTELTLHLEWSPELPSRLMADRSSGFGLTAPCLVLPDMLPSLVEVDRPIETFSRKRTRIRFAAELPDGLNAGGVAVPDWRGKPSLDLLQTVVCRTRESEPDYGAFVLTNAQRARELTPASAPYERLISMVAFIASELHVSLPVRPVVCLVDSYGTIYPSAGAFCPVLAADIEVNNRNAQRDVNTILLLAQAWLDGGIRIWGENALALRLGIGTGLGLTWLQRHAAPPEVDRAIAHLEAAVAGAGVGEEMSAANVARAIGLSVFRTAHASDTWRVLGALVRKRWGDRVAQQELIDLLRKYHVQVPHVFG